MCSSDPSLMSSAYRSARAAVAMALPVQSIRVPPVWKCVGRLAVSITRVSAHGPSLSTALPIRRERCRPRARLTERCPQPRCGVELLESSGKAASSRRRAYRCSQRLSRSHTVQPDSAANLEQLWISPRRRRAAARAADFPGHRSRRSGLRRHATWLKGQSSASIHNSRDQ